MSRTAISLGWTYPKNLPFVLRDSVIIAVSRMSVEFIYEKNFVSKIVSKALEIQSDILDEGMENFPRRRQHPCRGDMPCVRL